MKSLRLTACTAALLVSVGLVGAAETENGALRTYVAKPDDSFRWVKRREVELGNVSASELTLTSQTWRDIVWKHQLFVLKPPATDDRPVGMLFIGGGRWKSELEQPPVDGQADLPKEAALLAGVAATIRAPVAILLHVPQQPIFEGKVEDQIISYTFEQFYRTQDPEWPLLLPMVKSAVRAMDAVQQYASQEWSLDIQQFTVTGASKRGWTTWLTGAVDSRATAIAPMVIDVLNMPAQMKHQLEAYGKYSEEIEDYTRRGLQDRSDTPLGHALNAIVDPYSYRQVLTQPKLIMLGTNDRYWTLDALNLYWDGLSGEKHIVYVPNNGHGLKDAARIVGGLVALHQQTAGKLKLPRLEWELAENGGGLSLKLTSDAKPAGVSAWIASSPTLDFRDAQWQATSLSEADGGYRHELSAPSTGFSAMFGEAAFDAAGTPYFLSTNVKIIKAAGP